MADAGYEKKSGFDFLPAQSFQVFVIDSGAVAGSEPSAESGAVAQSEPLDASNGGS